MQSQVRKNQLSFRAVIMLMTFGLIPIALAAQSFQLSKTEGEVMVTGTSTLHDWEEVAEQRSGSMAIDMTGELPSISSLKFTVEAESLKSGHDGMDKNTYKALNTDKHKEIVFKMGEVKSISPVVSTTNKYKVVASGDLTIAGKTNKVDLPFTLTVNGGKAVLEGKKPLKMTDFGIEPPKALLGTIKTGDEIEVHYNTIWK
ncbi:YceI family protein [Flagellimonas pelagia]|uniref:YceI family protein n=1 Tax=Flagellimonas pelagia TaxID=2306998 RepID=A0A3A1NJC9_9FLAO|nr:YceI family protein [Allomuricauda maritima]RIV43518.1 YceI family protein [Allomuricauda maritima]TXJ92970.1 YceI family protein [Allomuricauda maritima]